MQLHLVVLKFANIFVHFSVVLCTKVMNNNEVLKFIISELAVIESNETLSLSLAQKLSIVTEKILDSKSIAITYSKDQVRLTVTRIYTKYKNNKKRPFNDEWNEHVCFAKRKVTKPKARLSDEPCRKVEKNILKCIIESMGDQAKEENVSKEVYLGKLLREVVVQWKVDNATLKRASKELLGEPTDDSVSVEDATALIYNADLSQRQYQQVRNIIPALPPRNDIDGYKVTLHPPITSTELKSSVETEELLNTTVSSILKERDLWKKLGDDPIHVICKAGLDGSGGHNHRKQEILSTDEDVPNSYIGMFVTPLSIELGGGDVIWENEYPNSQAMTRPLFLERAKEDMAHINEIFPHYDSAFQALKIAKIFDINRTNQISYDIKTTMIDGKMTSLLCGDSGAFCKYCFSSREQCSDLDFITEAGKFNIEKSYEQAQETWDKLESGEMSYTDEARKGQVNKPILTENSRFVAWMHQEPRSLDWALKILYHCVAGQRVWSESSAFVKGRVAEAKTKCISEIKKRCKNLLVDSPTVNGGNTNTGPTARRFFLPENSESISSLIHSETDRNNYKILLNYLYVMLKVNQQGKRNVDPKTVMEFGIAFMIHVQSSFPWVYFSPSVHQMSAHSWELFEMNGGKPVSMWSEQGSEAWNKYIRAWKSGTSSRSRQYNIKDNIYDVFRRMLITTHPSVAYRKLRPKKRAKAMACTEIESQVESFYV